MRELPKRYTLLSCNCAEQCDRIEWREAEDGEAMKVEDVLAYLEALKANVL